MKNGKLKFIPTELNFECWTAREITKMKDQINFLTKFVYFLVGVLFITMVFTAGLTNSYINHEHQTQQELLHEVIAQHK